MAQQVRGEVSALCCRLLGVWGPQLSASRGCAGHVKYRYDSSVVTSFIDFVCCVGEREKWGSGPQGRVCYQQVLLR